MRRNLKSARIYHGYSQEELAKEVERTQAWVSQIESGDHHPQSREAEKLSQILNLPPKYLLANVTLKQEKK